jgi:3-dehydroquinate dehydratase-2
MSSILVLHGPNLNLLGSREPSVYGHDTLESINQRLAGLAVAAGHHVQTLQTNAEHELIARVHAARSEGISFIILNPAGFTHTSVALRDALLGVGIPFIEVHLSAVAAGVITGLGALGYELAMRAALARLTTHPNPA